MAAAVSVPLLPVEGVLGASWTNIDLSQSGCLAAVPRSLRWEIREEIVEGRKKEIETDCREDGDWKKWSEMEWNRVE